MEVKEKKTFIYLIPKRKKKQYNECTELIIIREFIKLNHTIIPIHKFYIINIILYLLTKKIDGIIVNSIKILWKNKILLKFNSFIPIYWWYFDSIFSKEKIQNKVFYLAKNVSIFFNKNYNHFVELKKNGVFPIWLDQGISKKCEFINSSKYKYDIVFFGSISFDHTERTTILKQLNEKYNLAIFTPMTKQFTKIGFKNVFPAVKHEEIGKIVAESKITLVLNATTKEDYCWSNRIHLMLGNGAFCITDYIIGLEKSYVTGEDCIFVYNLDNLEKIIDEWIINDKKNERNRLRLNGYNKANTKHTYENRIKLFMSYI
ncbi:MAG: glycosyltransferase family 1 protein [Candidatus Cloacimonetes bacterium]|nr:glycosyltransferase family 1 protein [Pelagibacterales bacterium]MBL7108036.1 glycosyltransferase family 1 protein [Candidatus Cloacimonadota bacterium]